MIGRVARTAAMLLLTLACAAAAYLSGLATGSEEFPSRVMAWWGRWVIRAAGCRVRAEGAERLPAGGAVLVANHESYLDIPLLLVALGGRVKFVAKRELSRVPLFGPAMRRAGNLFVDRDDPRGAAAAMREAVERIGRGERLIVFPEGTRGDGGRIGEFRPGAFFMARRTGAPLVPVALDGGAWALPRGAFLVRSAQLRVAVLDPMSAAGAGREEIAAQARRRIAEAREELRRRGTAPM